MNEEIRLTKTEFRPDINGLRAVAVILVLLFHLEYNFAGAGFLGVDVFLVISGYLISRNILYDLGRQQFSFSRFYIKRFKRLFPALFVTLTLSLVAGFLTLTPANLERLSKSLISAVLFASNIFFYRETGYFDTESAFKPLLHIWSLSLEEQFYFVWPLLLFLIFKFFRKAVFLMILILALSSMFAANIYVSSKPDAVFYLLQFRFFEFLLGAACIWLERYNLNSRLAGELILLSGLALICYSATQFTVMTPMPGILSLVPCVGAMLVIYAGNTKFTGWLLRNKVMEIIGKSSYSVYLAHWPLIVYYKYYTLSELTDTSRMMIALATLLLGFLMWRYIENTFRRSNLKFWKIDAIWIWLPALMILLGYASWNIWENNGYPSRFPAQYVMTEDEIFESRKRYWQGSNSDKEVLKGSDSSKVIIMGNSYAIDLMYALRKNGFTADIIAFQTSHECYNFSAASVYPKDSAFCSGLLRGHLAHAGWSKAKAVYLFDHWPIVDLGNLGALLKKIRTITSAPVYVFGPKMEFSKAIPDIVHSCRSASAYAINNYAQQFAIKNERHEKNNTLTDFFKDESWKKDKIYFINVLDIQGRGENKFHIISEKTFEFLYFDYSHFTEQGAKEFGEKLKEVYPEVY